MDAVGAERDKCACDINLCSKTNLGVFAVATLVTFVVGTILSLMVFLLPSHLELNAISKVIPFITTSPKAFMVSKIAYSVILDLGIFLVTFGFLKTVLVVMNCCRSVDKNESESESEEKSACEKFYEEIIRVKGGFRPHRCCCLTFSSHPYDKEIDQMLEYLEVAKRKNVGNMLGFEKYKGYYFKTRLIEKTIDNLKSFEIFLLLIRTNSAKKCNVEIDRELFYENSSSNVHLKIKNMIHFVTHNLLTLDQIKQLIAIQHEFVQGEDIEMRIAECLKTLNGDNCKFGGIIGETTIAGSWLWNEEIYPLVAQWAVYKSLKDILSKIHY